MSQDAFEYLRNLPHFALLPEEEVAKIADAAQVRVFPEGTVLAEQQEYILEVLERFQPDYQIKKKGQPVSPDSRTEHLKEIKDLEEKGP